jgi:maltose alpha-D-glucosyltransferase/alpha-amylase
VALATPAARPAFDPEPVTAEDLARWQHEVHAEFETTLARVEAQLDTMSPLARACADRVLELREALAGAIRAVLDVPTAGLVKSRHHGDYHLGQVLVTKNDFVIVDFEGEPSRDIDARRQKHSPLRDVAGMLRSFDYVRHSALAKASQLQPGPGSRQAELADAWAAATANAFLEAYRGAATAGGVVADWNVARRLVEFFALEKALYEVRYELDNRPDWVAVPLTALAQLAART